MNWLLRSFVIGLAFAISQPLFGQGLYHYDESGQRVSIRLAQPDSGSFQIQVGSSHRNKDGSIAATTTQTLTNQFVVRANPNSNIHQLASTWGVSVVGQMNWDRNFYVLEGGSPLEALQIANSAFENGDVAQVFSQITREFSLREIPNDPNFASQWHLRNTGQGGGMAGHDINVEPLWNFSNETGLGTGVTIGVVDLRVQANHPDLNLNFRNDRSLWMTGIDSSHGTSVAGVIAARGNNGIGVTGVAPHASLAGISLLNQGLNDANEAQALTNHFNTTVGGQFDGVHIYNNSWGPPDNATRQAAGPLVRAALQNGVTTGRNGLGNIYVWAGGNGGSADDVNYDGYANSRYTIAVGATTNSGLQASYSERGACLFVNAMGNGGSLGISTTDAGSAYTTGFGGTSAAAPIVSGVVALMLEANPNLGWRDVQHILANTSRKNDPTNSTWVTNGSGRQHSDLYGFGTIDAVAAVTAAQTWSIVGTELMATRSATVNQTIPDSPGGSTFGTAITNTVNLTENLLVENVEVILNTTGGFGGDLEVLLTSPSGTQSTLARVHNHSVAYSNWMFSTVKNWGETSAGNWTLSVRDGSAFDQSFWTNWTVNVYGTAAIPEPVAGLLLIGIAMGMAAARRRT